MISGQLFDDAVELARAEAHAAAVERRVRPAGDDAGALLREPDPVALPPDARVELEVRAAVERPVGVAPKRDRHRRHRLRDHELAELADERLAVRVEGVGCDAEQPARDLAFEHREERGAADDAAAHVGAAAAVHEQHVRPELLDHVAVALGRERRACRSEDPDRAEVVRAPRLETRLPARHEERRADAHERRPGLRRHLPLPVEARPRRVAVEHHDRRAHEERGDERVPHHPRGRREPEEPAARLQVPAERVRLEVLEQDAAVPVDDRLRAARRPRGEEDEERMVERDGLERERRALGEQVAPRDAHRERRSRRRARARRAGASAARRGSSRAPRDGRSCGPGSRSRRRRAARRARAARGGRRRCGRRARARSSPRLRRCSRSRRTRRASPECSAGTRRRGLPGRHRAAGGRCVHVPPALGAPRTSARREGASASGRRRRPAPRPRLDRAGARRS